VPIHRGGARTGHSEALRQGRGARCGRRPRSGPAAASAAVATSAGTVAIRRVLADPHSERKPAAPAASLACPAGVTSREELPDSSLPCWRAPAPMPAGDGWAFEVKFDGMRLQLRRDGRAVCLRSRPGRDCIEEFPELAPIHGTLGRHGPYLAFDVLHLDGRSTRELPYERRRELLLDLARPVLSRAGASPSSERAPGLQAPVAHPTGLACGT
jgi:hypothetical protein